MKHLLILTPLLVALLTSCGETDEPSGSPQSPGYPTEAAMNIDQGKAHYTRVLAEIRAALRCGGQPLTWRVSDPENIEGAESDDTGGYTAYLYRSPLYVADVPCRGADFEAAVETVRTILEDNGTIADDVTLGPDADFAEGGEVKWRDGYDGTWTLASDKATALSVRSGTLPGA